MKYHMLDFIACPIDKHFPLRLLPTRIVTKEQSSKQWYQCEQYFGYTAKPLSDVNLSGSTVKSPVNDIWSYNKIK